jgi:multicomponent Na+:H+ antiporter subunit E
MAPSPNPRPDAPPGGSEGSLLRTVALVVILSAFWLLLSGRVGFQYFLFMAFAVGIVVLMNPERPFGSRTASAPGGGGEYLRSLGAFVRYGLWLVRSIVVANLDVARRILSPSMPIRPRLMVFRTGLESEVAQVMVANTITLTPGTVTMDLQNGTFLVHALHPETADAVVSGEVRNVVAPIFGESRSEPEVVTWAFTPIELRKEADIVPDEVLEAAMATELPGSPPPAPGAIS